MPASAPNINILTIYNYRSDCCSKIIRKQPEKQAKQKAYRFYQDGMFCLAEI